MGNRKFFRFDPQISEKQDIDIDQTRTAAGNAASNSAHMLLYAAQDRQQLQGEVARFTCHNHVQEPRLVGDVLRLGLVDRRLCRYAYPLLI